MDMEPLTGDELWHARGALGKAWCLGRPLSHTEMALLLGLTGKHAAHSLVEMEGGRRPISGPVSVLVRMMLAGCDPPTWAEALQKRRPKRRQSYITIGGDGAGASGEVEIAEGKVVSCRIITP